MKTVMAFDNGYQARIVYDPEIEMFRGEFIGLNGSADFYANDVDGLKREGLISLNIFFEICAQEGITPKKHSGKFALRLDPAMYASVAHEAQRLGKSINQFVADSLKQTLGSARIA